MTKTLLICYTDPNDNQGFDLFNNVQDFSAKHPDDIIKHIFNLDDKLLMTNDGLFKTSELDAQRIEKEQFEFYANAYGFVKSEYKAQIKFPNRRGTYEFYGFNRHNTKHKCLLREIYSKDLVKAPPEYVRRLLDEQVYHIS